MQVSEQNHTEWATIGKIVALLACKGELKVRLLTDIPNRFEALDVVYVGPAHQPRTVQRARPYKGEMIVLKLQGIDNANAAESLRNADLCIPLDNLAQLPADSYYQHDILGLRVLTLDGTYVGDVEDIITTGSNDVYAIKMPGAPASSQVLIPAIKDVIKQIDLQKHVIRIDPIPGLLDNSDRDLREEKSETLE